VPISNSLVAVAIYGLNVQLPLLILAAGFHQQEATTVFINPAWLFVFGWVIFSCEFSAIFQRHDKALTGNKNFAIVLTFSTVPSLLIPPPGTNLKIRKVRMQAQLLSPIYYHFQYISLAFAKSFKDVYVALKHRKTNFGS
jgi:hypothetical protein